MSGPQISLCSTILKEYYGKIVGKVAIYLVKNGPMPLGKILQECDMKVDEVNNRLHWLVSCSFTLYTATAAGDQAMP